MEEDYKKSLDKISPLVDNFPEHPFFPFIEAECLLKLGKIDEFNDIYTNLERFTNHKSEVIKNECISKINYLNGLKAYYEKDYLQSIKYNSMVIENYSMEFNWLLGLSYYNRANSYIQISDTNKAVIDFKNVLEIDFKFPEKKKAEGFLYDLSKVK